MRKCWTLGFAESVKIIDNHVAKKYVCFSKTEFNDKKCPLGSTSMYMNTSI